MVERDGATASSRARIGGRPDDANVGFLGVGPDYPALPTVTTDPLTASVEAVQQTGDVMWRTMKGLGSFFTGGIGSFADNVADGTSEEGPVRLGRLGRLRRPRRDGR